MDSESFKRTVMPCVDRMYRVAISLTGNEADAADAVQEACMKLWEHRNKLDSVTNIAAYTIGTVRNICLNTIEKRQSTTDIDIAFNLTSGADTEHEFETAEDMRTIEHIISGLPESQRAVMTMRDIEGLTIDEIGQATGYSAGNIRVLLHRARTTVKNHFRL